MGLRKHFNDLQPHLTFENVSEVNISKKIVCVYTFVSITQFVSLTPILLGEKHPGQIENSLVSCAISFWSYRGTSQNCIYEP